MGALETLMKSEMVRLAKKQIRPVVAPLSQQVRALNRRVRALTASNLKLVRVVRKLEAARVEQVSKLEVSTTEMQGTRMSPGLVKKLRAKLGLTQSQLAVLAGVSAAAVQSWEQGVAKPTGANRPALVALRKLGRRDVAKLLAEKGITPGRKRRAPKAAAPKTAKRAKTAKKTIRRKVGKKQKKASKKRGRPKTKR